MSASQQGGLPSADNNKSLKERSTSEAMLGLAPNASQNDAAATDDKASKLGSFRAPTTEGMQLHISFGAFTLGARFPWDFPPRGIHVTDGGRERRRRNGRPSGSTARKLVGSGGRHNKNLGERLPGRTSEEEPNPRCNQPMSVGEQRFYRSRLKCPEGQRDVGPAHMRTMWYGWLYNNISNMTVANAMRRRDCGMCVAEVP